MKNITKDYYERNHEYWSENRNYAFFLRPEFIKLISHLKKGDSVIELGCAAGNHVPLFLGLGRHLKYTGADISSNMRKIAKSFYPQLKFIPIDLGNPATYPRQKFSGFWANACMMHVPSKNWPSMMKSMTRMIKPGGYGFLSLPEKRPNPRSKDDQRHFTLLKPKDFRKIAENFGWRIISTGSFISKNNKTPWNWFIVRLPGHVKSSK